jgi:hypothetical protein
MPNETLIAAIAAAVGDMEAFPNHPHMGDETLNAFVSHTWMEGYWPDLLLRAATVAAEAAEQILAAAEPEHPLESIRKVFEATDRKAVTRASRLLVQAAGGEVIVPNHMADIIDQIELTQIDEPHRSRVIYRSHHAKSAAGGQVIDAGPAVSTMKRIGSSTIGDL